MNYATEPWYKLYIRESTEDRLLPVFNRALRDFLLRLAKGREDPTVLRATKNPGADLARALSAQGEEAAMIEGYVKSMLDDGYLSHEGDRLWITNFVEAQRVKSPGAVRQDKWRKKVRDATGDASRDAPRDRPRDAKRVSGETPARRRETTRYVSRDVTSDPIREETRREETRPERAREAAASAETPAQPANARGVGAFTHEASETETETPESETRDDPGRETLCPPDLADRLERAGTVRQLAERLAVPIESVRHELKQFEAYWVIGKGQGQKRTGWPGKARQWVVEQHAKPGGLKAPGAVAHAERREGGEYQPSEATAALMGGLVRRNL